MVVYWLFRFLMDQLKAAATPITLLPNYVMAPALLANLETARSYLAIAFTVIPATTIALVSAMIFVVVFEASFGTFKVVKWFYKKVPGIS